MTKPQVFFYSAREFTDVQMLKAKRPLISLRPMVKNQSKPLSYKPQDLMLDFPTRTKPSIAGNPTLTTTYAAIAMVLISRLANTSTEPSIPYVQTVGFPVGMSNVKPASFLSNWIHEMIGQSNQTIRNSRMRS